MLHVRVWREIESAGGCCGYDGFGAVLACCIEVAKCCIWLHRCCIWLHWVASMLHGQSAERRARSRDGAKTSRRKMARFDAHAWALREVDRIAMGGVLHVAGAKSQAD